MTFRVGLSSDLDNGTGGFSWGNIAIETLSPLSWEFLKPTGKNFTPESVHGFHAIAFAGPGVDSDSFGSPEESPLVLSRFGVGYDNIDLAACTKAGVALTITPDGSKKPVATAALTLVLSSLHKLHEKMNTAENHAWDKRMNLGQGLNGKIVATIGLGNIGSEFFRLIAPFDCSRIAFDPWKTQAEADAIGVTLVDLDTLLATADVVVVLATLTPETHHMLNKPKLALMKKNSILVNISRGPIIDEAALISVLENRLIAGAALDVFETEPPTPDNPLVRLENVIATPHNIGWTDELAFGMGRSAFTSIKLISEGKIPQFVVNKDVLETVQFKKKLAQFL
jgi:phosphoglycerate dehydrogenase-like enzyme